MNDVYDKERRKQMTLRRAIADYSMGAIFFLLGVFFLVHKLLGIEFGTNRSTALDIVFGIMCVLYGGWRIYRGYKKNYFKD